MPILEYNGLIFEWHDTKFELVKNQRAINFEEACSVLFDECSVTFEDEGYYGEQRLITVGMSNQARLLSVVWTEREDISRIITAFFPSQSYKKRYDNARRY